MKMTGDVIGTEDVLVNVLETARNHYQGLTFELVCPDNLNSPEQSEEIILALYQSTMVNVSCKHVPNSLMAQRSTSGPYMCLSYSICNQT